MVGRVIVALLVAASAAFVMVQRRSSETTSIAAEVTDDRARALAKHVEQQARTIDELTALLETERADARWQAQQLADLARDCTPGDEPRASVEIAALQRRAPSGDHVGRLGPTPDGGVDRRYALVLKGDAATISRVRLYPGLDDGTPFTRQRGCDTLSGESASLMGVVVAGRQRVQGFGPQALEKPAGTAVWELRCDEDLERGMPIVVEIVAAGAGAVHHALQPLPPPKAPPAPRESDIFKRTSVLGGIKNGLSSIEPCIESRKHDTPRGKVRLAITIAPAGVVTEAHFLDANIERSAVGRCVVLAAKRWRFSPFVGAPETVEVPLILAPP